MGIQVLERPVRGTKSRVGKAGAKSRGGRGVGSPWRGKAGRWHRFRWWERARHGVARGEHATSLRTNGWRRRYFTEFITGCNGDGRLSRGLSAHCVYEPRACLPRSLRIARDFQRTRWVEKRVGVAGCTAVGADYGDGLEPGGGNAAAAPGVILPVDRG